MADPDMLKRGGERQCISPDVIYCKCTQRTACLIILFCTMLYDFIL